jgi:NAD(P) transhydrogenase subunit beta
MSFWLVEGAYLVASTLFILSLHWMNDPKTARKGVLAGVVAMTLAILGTFLTPGIVHWGWIAGAVIVGFAIGVPLSWVPLTAVPQRTAISHAFGGWRRLLGTAKFYLWQGEPENLTAFCTVAISRGDPAS